MVCSSAPSQLSPGGLFKLLELFGTGTDISHGWPCPRRDKPPSQPDPRQPSLSPLEALTAITTASVAGKSPANISETFRDSTLKHWQPATIARLMFSSQILGWRTGERFHFSSHEWAPDLQAAPPETPVRPTTDEALSLKSQFMVLKSCLLNTLWSTSHLAYSLPFPFVYLGPVHCIWGLLKPYTMLLRHPLNS